jgi:catechol 2,3-dioxygenase-like lactoylglutathione lyase family enzyme
MATDATRRGIPAVTQIDHVAYNVPDMEQALAFFIDVLGCELLAREHPHEMAGRPGVRLSTAVLAYDDRVHFELLAFESGAAPSPLPAMTDPHGYHLALSCTDVPAAIAWLREKQGIDINEAPPLNNGRRRAFFTTPWGMSIQIIEPARGSIF